MNYIIIPLAAFLLTLYISRNRNKKYQKEAALLEIQNELLDISHEMQRLCEQSKFKLGDFEHDTFYEYLYFSSHNPGYVNKFHLLRYMISPSYRNRNIELWRRINEKLDSMPPELKEMHKRFSSMEFRAFLLSHRFLVAMMVVYTLVTQTRPVEEEEISLALRSSTETKQIPAFA